MAISRNRLYAILILSCIAGCVWLFLNSSNHLVNNTNGITVCMIKHITNIPCPSCGSTRSVLSILHGEYLEALYWNPLGFILILIAVTIPIWITFDCATKKNSLVQFYNKAETILRQKKIAIPALFLVLANWFWNIYKGL